MEGFFSGNKTKAVKDIRKGEKMKREELKRKIESEYDTTVQCPKCGRKQHLQFVNGLKNGWSKCCGYTMPIVSCTANIEEAIRSLPITVSFEKAKK